jgi:hypothetical protein
VHTATYSARTAADGWRAPSNAGAATDRALIEPVPDAINGEAAQPTSTFMEDLTVIAPRIVRHAEPQYDLALPAIPYAMRPYMSGRCVELVVAVGVSGAASALVTNDGGVQEVFVSRVVADATKPWRPAVTSSGSRVEDTRAVRYCWP